MTPGPIDPSQPYLSASFFAKEEEEHPSITPQMEKTTQDLAKQFIDSLRNREIPPDSESMEHFAGELKTWLVDLSPGLEKEIDLFVQDVKEELAPIVEQVRQDLGLAVKGTSKLRSPMALTARALQGKGTAGSNIAAAASQPSNVIPSYVHQVDNPVIDTTHTHIDGYDPKQLVPPGKPLPTNSWWTLLGDDRGSGVAGMKVVSDDTPITDPLHEMHLSDARKYDPNAKVDIHKMVLYDSIPISDPNTQIHQSDALKIDPKVCPGCPDAKPGEDLAVGPYIVQVPASGSNHEPSVNEGPYTIQSMDNGVAFNPSEDFQTDGKSYHTTSSSFVVAGTKEGLISPPTVSAYDDNSATLSYKAKGGGSMTSPIVRGSPYLTFQYDNVTPSFYTVPPDDSPGAEGYPIDMLTVHAYFYKQVIPNGQKPDEKTQITEDQAKALGLDSTVGHVDLVENTAGPPWDKVKLEGQVFSYHEMSHGVTPASTYRLYFSSTVTLNPCHYVTKRIIPKSIVPNPNPDLYVYPDPNANPPDVLYATKQIAVSNPPNTTYGFEASGPFTGTARIVKIPQMATLGKGGSTLLDATIQEINKLMAEGGKTVAGDLRCWANGLISSANFLQTYADIKPDDFYQFCRLTGFTQMEVEKQLAYIWRQQVPDPQSDGKDPGDHKPWRAIATQFLAFFDTNPTASQVQNWLKTLISQNGDDYKALDLIEKQFLFIFSTFGQPSSNLPVETDLHQALIDAQAYRATIPSDLYKQTTTILDKDAWEIPVSSHYQVDGEGKYSYTYTTDKVNPYRGLNFTNPPSPFSGHILTGVLKMEYSYPAGSKIFPDEAAYDTVKGKVKLIETTDNKVSFDNKATFKEPDADLGLLSTSDRKRLAQAYIDEVSSLYLKDRHDNPVTYGVGKNVQNAADIAHALSKLKSDCGDMPGFAAALQEATSVAEAGLDDYLTGGLLEYDKQNGMVISQFGQQGAEGKYGYLTQSGYDFYNAYGTDHHFAYGYLIRAAAELREVDPGWFEDPKWGTQRKGMVNLMIDDVFNVQNDPNFPRMRMWDPYVGVGRATGLTKPDANGVNEESTAEDYNCIQGIAMWANADGNTDLKTQAVTMAERVKNAAQAYWQPHSSTSIYTEDGAPQAAQDFAKQTVSCGINWDNNATSGNFFYPGFGDANIFTIGIEYITGNPDLVDYNAALAAYKYLIQENTAGFPRIFQYDIPFDKQGADGLFSYIPILVPLIAKVNPDAALTVLNWFKKANQLQPGRFLYDSGCNYATIYQQILMAKANKPPTPYLGPDPLSTPPLPPQDPNAKDQNPAIIIQGTAKYYLNPWNPLNYFSKMMPVIDDLVKRGYTPGGSPRDLNLAIADAIMKLRGDDPNFDKNVDVGQSKAYYTIYTQMNTPDKPLGKFLFDALDKEVDKLGANATVAAIRDWAKNVLLPSVDVSKITDFAKNAFCKIAQLDIHFFDQPTPVNPLDSYIQSLRKWETTPPIPSVGAIAFANAAIASIQVLEKQNPKATLQDAIRVVEQLYVDPKNQGRDIYMQYFGLSKDNMQGIGKILTSADGKITLSFPDPTAMDGKYTAAKNWLNTPGISANDKALAQAVANGIETKLGSAATIAQLTHWAMTFFSSSKENYALYGNASSEAKSTFEQITGVFPVPPQPWAGLIPPADAKQLNEWIDLLTHENSKFAQDIAKELMQYTKGAKPFISLQDVVKDLHDNFFQLPDKIDVYIRYMNSDDFKSIQNVINLFNKFGETPPPITQIDQLLNDFFRFRPVDLTGKDTALMAALHDKLMELGSQGDPNALKGWGKAQIGSGIFNAATKMGQLYFENMCGISSNVNPLDNYIQNLKTWETTPPTPSAGAIAFANAAIASMQALEKQNPKATLQDAIRVVEQLYVDPKNQGRDIYMQYFGLSKNNMQGIGKILTSADGKITLPFPDPTVMDSKYTAAKNWLNTPGISANDKALAQDLLTQIETKLGSRGSVDALKNWAQGVINNPNSPFAKASGAGQATFEQITGAVPVNPLDNYIQNLKTWETTPPVPSAGAIAFANAAIASIQALEKQNPKATLQDAIAVVEQLYADPKNQGRDIYMQYFGLSKDNMQGIGKILTSADGKITLPFPDPTVMDSKYTAAKNWLNTPGISANDKALAQDLLTQIETKLGSRGSVDALKNWAQGVINDPNSPFAKASGAGQATFEQITGVVPVNPLDNYIQNLKTWETTPPIPSAGAIAFANAAIASIQALEKQNPKATLQDAIAVVEQLYADPKNQGRDIYMQYFGLSKDNMQGIGKILTSADGKITLPFPDPTVMDSKYTAAKNWLNTPGISDKDKALAQAVVTEIETKLGSGATIVQLMNWSADFLGVNSNYALYAATSRGAQAQFQTITQIPLASIYAAGLLIWAKQFKNDSVQYEFGERLSQYLANWAISNPSATLKQIIAFVDHDVYHNPINENRDIYISSFGLTHDDLVSVSNIFSDGTTSLDVPPFTQMDQAYKDAMTKFSSPVAALAEALQDEIASLGSNANLSTLKAWAQGLINGRDTRYTGASAVDQATFQQITGAVPVNPLDHYIQNLKTWETTPPVPSAGAIAFANAAIASIQALEKQNPKATLQDAIRVVEQLYADPKNQGRDIYMQYFGLSKANMQSIGKILTSADGKITLPFPDPTAMDGKYTAAKNWFNTPGISANDKALAQDLVTQIETKFGSEGNLDALKNWAQGLVNDPTSPFAKASGLGQATFEQITGTTPPTNQLAQYEKEIARYLGVREGDWNQFVIDLGSVPGINIPPRTDVEWNKLKQLGVVRAGQLAADINQAKRTGNWQALQAKWKLDLNGRSIEEAANGRLDAYQHVFERGRGSLSAITLYTQALTEIKQLEGSGGTVADLNQWAKGVNLSNYPYLTEADKAEFNKLLGS